MTRCLSRVALSHDDCYAEKTFRLKPIDLTAALILCFLSVSAFAQPRVDTCAPDVYETVKRNLKMSEFSPRQDGGNVISAACRVWPYKAKLLLAAFAYDEGVENEKQLLILVLDERTKRVIRSFRSVIGEDAITEVGDNSLKLDTARYQLTENVRAFGVRFNSAAHGANCGSGYSNDELTLFVPESKKLRPVLSLNLYHQQWLSGCPAATTGALWEDALLSISMAKTSANGYYDVVVSAKITVNAEDAPTGDHKDRIERHILHYDGNAYSKGQPVPWWLEF